MGNKSKEELIAWLRWLETDPGFYPKDTDFGICGNIISENFGVYALGLLQRSYLTWPKYTGMVEFPVPHPEHSANSAYLHVPNVEKWDASTEYGRNRRELCGHFANYLEDVKTL